MNELVMWEARYVGECLLLGAGLMFLYDILRIIRIVVPHSIVVISIEDLLYWFTAGGLMFMLLYKEDAGSIRWFAVVLTVLGMVVYNCAVSRYVVPFVGKCIRWPVLQIARFFSFIASKIKSTGKMVTVLLKKLKKKAKIEKKVKKRRAKKETGELK